MFYIQIHIFFFCISHVKNSIGALAACNLVINKKERIFNTLYKALNSANSEIQETAHESMKMVYFLNFSAMITIILDVLDEICLCNFDFTS